MTDFRTDVWCHSHAREEWSDADTYRICVECGHVYQTEQDLVDACNRWQEDLAARDGYPLHPNDTYHVGDTIAFCQECLHDW